MNRDQQRLDLLLKKFTQNDITSVEYEELCNLVQDPSFLPALKASLASHLQGGEHVRLDKQKLDDMLRKVMAPARVYKMQKPWRRAWIAAAAIIIIMIGLGIYRMLHKEANQNFANNEKPIIQNDVKAPSKNNAVITLANGEQILLDSAATGSLATQGNVNVSKTGDGQIVYSGTSNAVAYNRLLNPRGSKVITVNLSDGTRVWLNAESSLRFPTAFVGSERVVELTGEGYFEVAHNASMPFKVKKDDKEVRVLGTHFNVNAYTDEPAMKVTLLEGSVTIHQATDDKLLAPGEQAAIRPNEKIIINKHPDLVEVMAWKNGTFVFQGNNIQSVMRQLARWYDVDVTYSGDITKDEFVGELNQSRYQNISEVLKMLERTRTVSFIINGRHVTVTTYTNHLTPAK